jgi:long-chain acyl-CoA synthetase
MACGLMSLGIAKGEKVAILSSTRVEWTLADIACILCGLITVPIYPSSLPDQVEYILSHSGSRAAFVEDESQWNKLAGARGKLPELSAVILFTGNPHGKEGAIGIADLRARGTEYRAAHPDALAARMEDIRPEDDLTIIYTSGTTGPPKGALIRHSNLVFDVTAALEVVPVPRGDVMLQFLPLAHVLGRFEHFLSFDAMTVTAFARGIQTVAEDLPAVRPHIRSASPPVREVLRRRPCQGEPGGRFKSRLRLGDFGRAQVSERRQRRLPVGGWLGVKFSLADRLVFDKIRARLEGGSVSSFGGALARRSRSSSTPWGSSSWRATASRRRLP